MNTEGIKWLFDPPASPHFACVLEIMVKAAKRALKTVATNAEVSEEKFHNFVVEAGELVNSRPLTPQSSDVNDEPVLTPNTILHGRIGGRLAPPSDDDIQCSLRNRWRRIQELLRHFSER